MRGKLSALFLVLILIVTNVLSFNLGQNTSPIGSGTTSLSRRGTVDSNQSDKLTFLEKYIEDNYLRDVTQEELYVGQLKGMVEALDDPYSEYLTSEELDDLMEDTSGKFFGIGVYINAQDGYVTVVSPIKNTPAERAGLRTGDKIIKVDGVDISGANATEASKMIKGEKGTTVTLTILRMEDEVSNTFDVDVTRDEITVVTVESEIIEGDILYINISQFNEQTYKEFMDAYNENKANAKSIILDLRNNPGGLLSTSTAIADELLPEGLIVYTERKGKETDDQIYSDSKMIDLPMVVLINEGSASASEIVSGAIRDYDRAVLIGKKSFGKGVVQTIDSFTTGDGIKLTISEYFTPKGISIHEKGIEPDIEVELDDPDLIIGLENLEKDNQLQRAIEELKK